MSKYKQISSFVFAVMITVLLAGCSTDMSAQPIDEDVDVCAFCHMSVADNQFAVQHVDQNGNALKFDDVGCMARYLTGGNAENGISYVRDFYSREWIEVEKAHFVKTDDVMTPMHYGFVSFADQQSMENFLRDNAGNAVSWEEVIKWANNRGHTQ